jgi:hypothetical protein
MLRGFRVAHVFDISQTDGPALPDVLPNLLEGAAPLGVWADLLDQVEAAGFTFNYTDHASLGPANGLTHFAERTVVVRDDLPDAQRVKTLAHELAHVRLHDPADPSTPTDLTRARAEVEAESVAHVVCAAHGLATDAYTVPYVAGWAGGNTELLQQTAIRVLSTARTILSIAAPDADGLVDPAHLAATRQSDRTTDRTAARALGLEVGDPMRSSRSAAARALADAAASEPLERPGLSAAMTRHAVRIDLMGMRAWGPGR